jgi:hypothetical protein
MLQHLCEVLPGMPAAGEVERDPVSLTDRHDPAGKHTRALLRWIALQHENAHASVVVMDHRRKTCPPGPVVMDHRALRGLPNQFIPRRLDHLRNFFDDLPLRSRRQRDAQLALQLFQPVEHFHSRCNPGARTFSCWKGARNEIPWITVTVKML